MGYLGSGIYIFVRVLPTHQLSHSTTDVIYCIFMAVQFVVEMVESALIFTGGFISFVAYLLTGLDLVFIAPAASIVFVSVASVLIQLFNINDCRTLVPILR